MRWEAVIQPFESICHLAIEFRKGWGGGGGGGGGVWSLLCKMEMSLPRFAVAKLFWSGSHWKTLGRAGKIGHLHEQGSGFFWEARGGEG